MGRKAIAGTRKWSQLRIRLTEEERTAMDAAAGEKGTSTWARDILLAAAKRKPPKPSR